MALEDALLRGCERLVKAGVVVEDLDKVVWLRRAKKWLDPKAEAEGAVTALKGNAITKRDYYAEQGKDWQDEVEQQLAEEAFERQKRADLELGGDSVDRVGPQWVEVLQQVLVAVTAGQLPKESAIALIQASFPRVTKEQVEAMVEPAAKAMKKPEDEGNDQGEDGATKDEGEEPVEGGEPEAKAKPKTKPRHLNRVNGAREVLCG